MEAVVDFQGHQYQIAEGQEIIVDRLSEKKGTKIKITSVLLLIDGDKAIIGSPLIDGAQVIAEILEHFRGEKVRVAKYRAKSRYRRVKGFRPELTRLKIKKIEYHHGKNKS